MAKDSKFRGNVYNQPKQTPAQEFQEVLETQAAAPQDTQAVAQEQLESPATPDSQEALTISEEEAQEKVVDYTAAINFSSEQPVETLEATSSVSTSLVVEVQNYTPEASIPLKEEAIQVPEPTLIHPEQKAQTRIMKSVERDLVSYMEAVHPKKAVNDETGGAWQGSLFQTFKRILSNPEPEDFKTQWNTLLAFCHKHQAEMFNENFMFRFQSTWKGSVKDYTTFRHLVYLVIRTANPQTRQKESRDIVLDRITQGLDATAATNLVNYYS